MSISNNLRQAFDNFMNQKFEDAVDASTTASFSGGYYSVELFRDGTYRILWSGEIGNLYDSPGIVIRVPFLSNEDWDEDPHIRFYDNARDEMRAKFEQVIEDWNLA